jgi:hypothetical protein
MDGLALDKVPARIVLRRFAFLRRKNGVAEPRAVRDVPK